MLLSEPRTLMATLNARLGAMFIISIVASSAGVMYSLLASNVAGYITKMVSGALFFSTYCIANIVSPQTFLASQAPRYQTGIVVSLAAFAMNIVLFSVLYVVYRRANAARDRDQDGQGSEDDTWDLLNAFSNLTDKENKRMRYKL